MSGSSLVRCGPPAAHREALVSSRPVSLEAVAPAGTGPEAGGLKAVVERAAKVADEPSCTGCWDARTGAASRRRAIKISYRTLLRKIEEHGLNGH
jgi:hypothetical protein